MRQIVLSYDKTVQVVTECDNWHTRSCHGFSIDSNDATQLTPGLDRDTEIVSYVSDETGRCVHTDDFGCHSSRSHVPIDGTAIAGFRNKSETTDHHSGCLPLVSCADCSAPTCFQTHFIGYEGHCDETVLSGCDVNGRSNWSRRLHAGSRPTTDFGRKPRQWRLVRVGRIVIARRTFRSETGDECRRLFDFRLAGRRQVLNALRLIEAAETLNIPMTSYCPVDRGNVAMIDLQRIVVPTDFSRCSEIAVAFGCLLAEQFRAELHLLYVKEDLSWVFPDGEVSPYGTGEILPHQREIVIDRLGALPGEPWRSQLHVTRVVRDGTACTEIVSYAAEASIDLIVVGSHGRSGIGHVILGSVAQSVVRKSPCPVMTVRSPPVEESEPADSGIPGGSGN